MKKIMIATVAITLAAVTQAATVNWGGAFATPDGNATLPVGTQAALLYSATAFSGAATQLDAFSVGSVADNGGSIVQIHSVNATEAANWEMAEAYGVDGSVDGYYAVLFLNDAGNYASYYELTPISGTTGASAPTDRKINQGWTGAEYLTSGDYTVAVGAVPEPTSGLLLLLGVAGLALRRRRA